MICRIVYLLLAACLIVSCSPVSKRQLTRTFRSTEGEFQDHTGFMLYDPQSNQTIYEYNAAKYFTPASNTKILTLFASLNILGDSVPALRYLVRGDSMIFWGTGDPSFLYRNVYDNHRVYSFLHRTSTQHIMDQDGRGMIMNLRIPLKDHHFLYTETCF